MVPSEPRQGGHLIVIGHSGQAKARKRGERGPRRIAGQPRQSTRPGECAPTPDKGCVVEQGGAPGAAWSTVPGARRPSRDVGASMIVKDA